MQAIWVVIAFAVGGLLVYLLNGPQVNRSQEEAASERRRANESEALRHNLELEIAGMKTGADRVRQLESEMAEGSAKILNLTEKYSAAITRNEEHDKTIVELKNQISSLSEEIKRTKDQLNEKTNEHAELSATLREREAALKDEREQLSQMTGALKAQFAELSIEALKNNSNTFLDTAKHVLARQHQEAEGDLDKKQQEIASLIKPIEDGIKAVGDATRAMEIARENAFGNIEARLVQSIESAAEVAKQTGALKDALKRPNVRGRWGEVHLKLCAELAGMEEHCDVEFQETSLSAEDELLRPDMIVRMPGGRKITVDSKTPMDHFLAYIEASTEDQRQLSLANHGKAVRKHVSDLSKTDYMQRIAESPDFVVMFLPNESFLAMALEKEPTLMEDALKKKVLIATPGTLIGLLKVVQYGWNEQKVAQNAQQIAEEGTKLNGELVRFLGDFARLGLAIETVNEAFGDSKRRIENQIARASVNLTTLGAKNRASLPKGKRLVARVTSILKTAGADDATIEQTERSGELTPAPTAMDEASTEQPRVLE